MKLKIAICDDCRGEANHIEDIVRDWCGSTCASASVAVFPSAEAFLFRYLEEHDFDILLLDVEMGRMSGIELAKKLRRDGSRAEILFITSHTEFYGEGYEVDALHYLIKPVSKEKLTSLLSKACERIANAPSVVITSNGETVKLFLSDILYAEARLHYVLIHTAHGDYEIKDSLSSFEQSLTDEFFKTHRSYTASLRHVSRISRTEVHMSDGTTVPLSRGKYDAIHRAFIDKN